MAEKSRISQKLQYLLLPFPNVFIVEFILFYAIASNTHKKCE